MLSLFHNILNYAGPLGKSSLSLTPRDSVKFAKFDHFTETLNSTNRVLFKTVCWVKFAKPVEKLLKLFCILDSNSP